MIESIDARAESRESGWVTVARAALLLTAFVPVILFPHFLFPFVTTRNIFFRICVEVSLAAILIAGIRRLRDASGAKDPILLWLFAYLVAISLAGLLGLSPWHSLFGDFERMGGIWAWLHLLIFFVMLRVALRPHDWVVFFRCILVIADLVVIWGSLEFLPMSVRNPSFQMSLSFGSTIGNQGLLGPYLLLSLVVAALLLSVERKKGWMFFLATSCLLLLFGLAGSRNRSAELGLFAGVVVAVTVMFFLDSDRRRFARRYSIAAAAGLAIVVFGGYMLNLRAPAIADRFGGRWKQFVGSPIDHARTIEWSIAVAGFEDRPLFGFGPENHEIVASHHFDPRIYDTVAGGGVFDRAHNEWLELLATSGIVGMVAMAGIWIAAIQTIRKGVREHKLAASEAALLSGSLAAYAVYLTFWFFDLNSVFIWVTLLAFLANRVFGRPRILLADDNVSRKPVFGRFARSACVVLIFLAAYLHGVVPLVTAHNLSVAAENGMFQPRLDAFYRVMNSVAPQTLHTFPLYYQFLRNSSGLMGSPSTDPFFRREFALALRRGEVEADRSISRNPEDDRSYLNAARFHMMEGLIYRDSAYLVRARKDLLRAVTISPRRPDIRLLLSNVYLTLGDSSSARTQLDSAIALAPQFGPSFFYRGRLALAQHSPDSAAQLLTLSLRRNFAGSQALFGEVTDSLVGREENLPAAKFVQAFLESVYGPMKSWTAQSIYRPRNTPLTDSLAMRLPILYLKGGDTRLALASTAAVVAIHPDLVPAGRDFATAVRSGHYDDWKKRTSLGAGR